jgi:hypothetical protein
MEMV